MCENYSDRLIRAILSLKDSDECERLLSDLFTSKEVKDISSRLEVAHLLSRGVNYNEIARVTGASTATISRVSKCLSGEVGGYRIVLPRIWGDGAPGFNMLLSSDEDSAALYAKACKTATVLPRLPEGGFTAQNGDITLTLADSRDIPALLLGGGYDFALCSTLPLLEEGVEFDTLRTFPKYENLIASDSTSPTVLTAYPVLVASAYKARMEMKTVLRIFGEPRALAVGVATASSVITDTPCDGALVSAPFALVCRKNAPKPSGEFLLSAFGG